VNLTSTTLPDLRTPEPHHASRITHHASRTAHHAFTLVEILVSITLLSLIVLGLFAMFNQVQRAFRSSMNQVDELEAGRAVTGLIPAELEQTTPCSSNAVIFSAQIIGSTAASPSAPLTQSLPGTAIVRTNLLEDCFALQRQNQTWTGIGYCVRTNDSTGRLWLPESGPGQLGVGTLFRFSISTNVLMNNGVPYNPGLLYAVFQKACVPGSQESLAISNRICDGVIHFRLRAFATNGFPIYLDNSSQARFQTNAYNTGASFVRGVTTTANYTRPDNWSALYFVSNAVPASVELELGILEQHVWERYNSIDAPLARLAYLRRDDIASRVHLFRQRVQIRNVDPLAYQ
jgi:prepilin-type N-terminal cleavage/methylation domain-containing protein